MRRDRCDRLWSNYVSWPLVPLLCFYVAALAPPLHAIEHDTPGGEPYQPSGKRIVFTSWYYVRPGQLDWLDAKSRSVYASSAVKAGPADALFAEYDAACGIRLEAEAAQIVGPMIRAERPWEGGSFSVATILHEDGEYRMWAMCQDPEGKERSCYFASTDGRTWNRPELGLVAFNGSTANNLLPFKPGSVFKDPVASPGERYKAVWHGDLDPKRFKDYKKRRPWSVLATESDPGRVHSVRAAVSPDGFRWTELPDSISVEVSDTHIVAYYDTFLNKYILYTRNYMIGPRAHGYARPDGRWHEFLSRRAIGRSESSDFRVFPLSDVIIEPSPDMAPSDSYYTNCRTPVPGAPDHHLMFPAVYHQDRDTTSIELHSSYDGKIWHKLPGSPVCGTADFGRWNGGCVFASPQLLELPDGSWALPLTGYAYPHKYPRGAWKFDVGLAVWPKGRLVALRADGIGAFATAVFVPLGPTMKINAVTERAGSIRVEVTDLEGKTIPGRSFDEAVPIVGDHFWTPVTWKDHTNLGTKEGDPVMLRFHMDKARIYGLQFDEAGPRDGRPH